MALHRAAAAHAVRQPPVLRDASPSAAQSDAPESVSLGVRQAAPTADVSLRLRPQVAGEAAEILAFQEPPVPASQARQPLAQAALQPLSQPRALREAPASLPAWSLPSALPPEFQVPALSPAARALSEAAAASSAFPPGAPPQLYAALAPRPRDVRDDLRNAQRRSLTCAVRPLTGRAQRARHPRR